MEHDTQGRSREVVIPADLLRAFEEAHYWVDGPGGRLTLKIGELFAGLDGCPGNYRLAIVTAWNPFSQVLGHDENAQRQTALVEEIEGADLAWFPAAGVDAQGKWAPEESLGILGATTAQLDGWMEAFDQYAIVVAARGESVTLRLHPRHTANGTQPSKGECEGGHQG